MEAISAAMPHFRSASLFLFVLPFALETAGQAESTKAFPAISTAKTPELESDTSFRFIVTGDGRPTAPNVPLPRIQEDIVREIALLRPEFVLYSGDTIFGYNDTRQEMLNEVDRFRALIDTAGVPFFNCPGNHDMQSKSAAMAILKEKGQEMYGSFDVGKCHFIALNTDEVNHEQDVSTTQIEWLKKDLEANKGAAGIFVFMHRPMSSWFRDDFNPDTSAILRPLFVKHRVKAVFAGHDHYYAEHDIDGVRYITAGGGGAPLNAQPPKGGYAHYIIVKVSPEGVKYQVIEPDHLEVSYIAGNDGFEPVSVARVVNTSATSVLARNLSFRVPRMPAVEHYKVTAEFMDEDRKTASVAAKVRDVTDLHDGSVRLGVEVPIEAGYAVQVRVEAREPVRKRL